MNTNQKSQRVWDNLDTMDKHLNELDKSQLRTLILRVAHTNSTVRTIIWNKLRQLECSKFAYAKEN